MLDGWDSHLYMMMFSLRDVSGNFTWAFGVKGNFLLVPMKIWALLVDILVFPIQPATHNII